MGGHGPCLGGGATTDADTRATPPVEPRPGTSPDATALLALHLPQDRRRALLDGHPIPPETAGSAMFADLSGFSALAERLTAEHGPRRGAEELTRALDGVFGALVAEADRRDGSVLGFSGDAITVWFPDDDGTRAAWAALAMRDAIAAIPPLSPGAAPLGIKVAVATGPARRFLVGDPAVRRFDVLAGPTVDRMAAMAGLMKTGELLVDETTALVADPTHGLEGWRPDPTDPTRRFAVLTRPAHPDPAASDEPTRPDQARTTAASLAPDALAGWIPPRVAERLVAGSGALIAELRPAVSLFISLGGLSLDHPDGADTLDRTVRWIEGIVAAEDGTPIDITIGEKGSYLFVVFGAPAAHDDDPERALRAARAIVQPPPDLGLVTAPRVGIARGRVRVGEFGGATRRTYGLQGREVVIAARLMEQAGPGEVVVSDRIASAVGSRTRLEPLGAITVKGAAQPVELFRLPIGRDPGQPSWSGAAARPVVGAALVGRERELARLRSLAADARAATRIALLVGEPGLGKSRLVEDVLATAAADARILRIVVDPIDRDIPYAGWRPAVAELLDATPGTAPDEPRDRVAAALDPADRERLPLLDPLLPAATAAVTPDTEATAHLDPAARQDETHRLLLALLEARRGDRPLVLSVDDAQWLDSLSWALLLRVARDAPRLFVLATLRKDAADADEVRALLGLPGAERVDLGPIDADAVTGLARQALGVEAIPDTVARFIAERGGGNPLHCQELALALRDAGEVLVGGGHARLREGADLAAVAFPESVEGVIGVRLDRLPPRLQDLLKVASVLDGAVRTDDLAALSGSPPSADALADLAAADLLAPVIPADAPPERPVFAFRHALVRAVAYERLLFEQRRELHRRYAERLESTVATDAAPDAQLAHHWERAGVVPRAIDHLERAGESAFRDGGFPEAAHLLGRALELSAAPASAGSSDAASPAIDPRRRAGWQWTAAQATYRMGDLQRSRALAEAALAAYDRPLPEGRVATIPVLTGQIGRQLAHRLRPGRFIGRAASEPEREGLRRATRACFNLAEVYYLAGLQERSALAALRGLNLAERLGPSAELVEAYGAIAIIGSLVGQHGLAARYGRYGRATADTIRDPFASALIAHQLTMSRCGVGPAEPMLTEALAGIDGFRAIGDKGRYRDALGIAASGAWLFGRTALCETWFRAHVATHAADERSLGLAWAWGWLGAAALRRDDPATALDLLERSIAAETGVSGTDITGIARQGWLALALHRLGLTSAATAEEATWTRIRATGGRPAGHPVIDGYLALWEIVRDRLDAAPNPGARAAAREQARELVRYLDRYRKVYPVGRSPHLRVVGELQLRDGDRTRATASLRAALDAARGLDQQADLALTHAALARALPGTDPERDHHRAEAVRLAEACGMATALVMEGVEA